MNVKEVLKYLAGLGVIEARVEFAGSGDSGQIQDVNIEHAIGDPHKVLKMPIEVPEGVTTQYHANPPATVEELLEELAYHAIENTGLDWYNNDGGQGSVRIVPGTGELVVDIGINYTTTDESRHDYSLEPDEIDWTTPVAAPENVTEDANG